ncbi:MAG TPA: DUF4785 domain-containing protein [Rhodanobacteraceae bacterium]|nr:DUF4785 domain-containing protein [Rhodanobacteraceae bacterium]
MQTRILRVVCVLLVAAVALPALASHPPARLAGTLLAPVAGDQVPAQLQPVERVHVALDHAPAAISWAVPADKAIDAQPRPYQAISRQYLINASGAELQRGVPLSLTAPGAIVRISPLGSDSAAIQANTVQFASGGLHLDADKASVVVASGQQMARAGMPVQRGSAVFKLNARVQPGTARITAAGARGNYLIQVFEPHSPYALQMAAQRGTSLAGQSVRVTVGFAQPSGGANIAPKMMRARLTQVSGVVEAPDGWSGNVDFSRGPAGTYVANFTPPAAHAGERGLWEIHAFARGEAGGRPMVREATNAFAVVIPTARFSGSLTELATHAGQDFDVDVGINVAAASRYAVSGVLYGHAANGQLRPAVYAQAAAWLQPGKSVPIRLEFSAPALASSGLKGPYQLRDLTLDDQQQLGVLERRAVAATGLAASP